MSIITPVVLSGGSGTRLWPLSRSQRPKQLLSLTHDETMLQLTALRTADASLFGPAIVVANAAHAEIIEEQMAAIGAPLGTLVLEPAARNTAPAIALAALVADEDAVLLVMPSDHVIDDVPAFLAAVDRASGPVSDGWMATFGIMPDGPETGYGYIQVGAEVAGGVCEVVRFVEKPDRATAEAYLAQGGFVWNSGIFLFGARAYLEALAEHAPAMLEAARAALAAGSVDGSHVRPDRGAFLASPSDSIDYAVMEKVGRVAVVPTAMGWSDVGSWDALHALADLDGDGNAHHGEVVAIDTSRCLIRSHGPMVAAVGISDLIVVATPDAVLVIPRGGSQDVKRAVEALKALGHASLDTMVG